MSTTARAAAEASVRRALERIAVSDPGLRAIITRLDEPALRQARLLDAAPGAPVAGHLAGRTLAVKDNIDTLGTTTTCGSASRVGAPRATADARVVAGLRRHGIIPVAKTNMSELGLGVSTDNAVFGTCRNAWNPERIPGGSSGGSAVAVAAGMADLALGTDTGGSIRLPASANGLVGLRPTFGRLSTDGVDPASPSVDTVGPMATNARDVAALLDDWSTLSPRPPGAPRPGTAIAHLARPLAGLRIGIPTAYFFEVESEIGTALEHVLHRLTRAGAVVLPVALPGADEAPGHLYTIAFWELLRQHRDALACTPELFEPEVRARILTGASVTDRDRTTADAWRRAWQHRVEVVLSDVEVIVTPTVPRDLPRVGEPFDPATLTRCLGPWSLYSGPSLTVPCGLHPGSGVPIGLQVTGRPWQDAEVVRVAHHVQGLQPLPGPPRPSTTEPPPSS